MTRPVSWPARILTITRCLWPAGLLVVPTVAAQAQTSYFEQKTACMGDAIRLCGSAIPDRQKIIACMAARHAELSAGCVPVFDANMRALHQQSH